MENKEIVFKALKDTVVPLKAGEIAGKTELDKKEVDRAMKILKIENLIELCERIGFAELVKTRVPAACGGVSEHNKNIQLIDDWLRRARKNSGPRGLPRGESISKKMFLAGQVR